MLSHFPVFPPLRAQHDAHIFTNDGSKLHSSLTRESSQRTATEVEQELAAPQAEPVSQRGGRSSDEEQVHSLELDSRECLMGT